MEYATVARINWGDGTVDLLANDGTPRVDVPWLGKFPPPPLSSVLVDDVGGQPIVRGPAGQRRLVFHDDFLHVAGIGLVPWYGDTPWTFPTLGDQGTATAVGGSTDAVGVCRLTTNDGNTTMGICKTDGAVVPQDGVGYWVAARVASTAYNNNRVFCGFRSSDGSAIAYLHMNNSPSAPAGASGKWRIGSSNTFGSGTSDFVAGAEPVDDTWQYLDVVLIGGTLVAGWVDGDGPGMIEDASFVPNALTPLQPSFHVRADNVPSARSADIDWMHFETFTPIVRAARVLEVFA